MHKLSQFVLNLDRRVIYTLVMLCVLGPLLFPVGLPFKNTEEVRKIYEAIEALPPGSALVISCDYGPGSMAETNPMYIALLHHCFKRKLRPIVMSLTQGGDVLAQQGLAQVLATQNAAGEPAYGTPVNGKDYVYLGYKAGTTAVVLALTQSFTATFPVDGERKPTAGMPIFQQVRKLSDTKFIMCIASVAMPEAWLPYGAERANVPMAVCCTAVSAAQYYPYYRQHQFVGLAGGMKGSAEYEQLVGMQQILGRMADATQGLDAQSLVHVFIVLSIVIVNFFYIIDRRRQAAELRS